ncbi:MAG: tetratricopeptide repeat-containing sensor histidine kinase [Chitinophagaceae bacterium]
MIAFKKFPLLIIIFINCILADTLHAQSLLGQALADSLLQELPKTKSDTAKIKILYSLAITLAPIDSAKAFNYANQCMNISKQVKWPKGTGLSYLAVGKIYKEITNFTASLQNCQTAFEIFKKANDKKNMAAALGTIAVDYIGLGYYTKAIENNFAALKMYEEINDNRGVEIMYSNIGVAYYYLLDYTKAIDNYKKALPMCRQLNDKYGIASALDNIAIAFLDEDKLDSANVYDLQALKIFEAINHQPALGRIYANRGDILSRLHDAKSAFTFYNRAIEINKRLGIDDGLGSDYTSVGSLFLELAKDSSGKFIALSELKTDKNALLKKAELNFAKALPLIKNSGDINFLMNTSLLASETEERLGNYHTALAFHKDYTLYKDSIFNDANKKKIAAMEMERLTEVKNKEILLLNQQKALAASEIKRQTLIRNIIIFSVIAIASLTFTFVFLYNRRKKAKFDKQVMEVETKALRAQMNPHFIFNSLHSINKYVVENDKDNASAYLSKFANLMRLILENSREQEVPLEKDLHALELYMQLEALRMNNKFKYSIETSADIDKENTLIPPMLLQPFVENAIIHGVHNKEDGMIKIKVNKENEMICCVIEDNGNGEQSRLISKGLESEMNKSLGRKIISERLNIINQIKKAKSSVNIFDLKDADNKPRGLRIELLLPFELAF